MDEVSQAYLDRFLKTLPPETANKYTSFSADYFCGDEYNANLCAELILQGEKRASCSLAHWYRVEGETMPTVGHLQVVTNWQGDPVCIIEITSVTECQYNQVSPAFAAEEGEGDKSLAWWRNAHWAFFSRECNQLGIEPNEEMALILERFNVVYK